MSNFLNELKWRGLFNNSTPNIESYFKTNNVIGYIGFDPTSDSLHIGSLMPILILMHLQKAGHKPIALVGGATGMVGDPSGKSEERNLLDEATLQKNLEGIKKQLSKFLDFNSDDKNGAELVNNYDWFKDYSFLNFIRDVGKFITVNSMMSKDSVKKRLESENGMSFTEFTYQLVQGYDFYWLYHNKNCKLQLGGSDQWGNMVAGTELIRKKTNGEAEAYAITCPLLTKSDGGKFGKSEKGNIWLDPEKTSPYEFYQFWIRSSDEDAEKWIKIFTFLNQKQIEDILTEHNSAKEKKLLQKTLAKEVTTLVHGVEECDKAIETTEKLFSNADKPATEMSLEDLQNLQGVVTCKISKNDIAAGKDLVSLLAELNIFSSKGEARKMILGGGVSINRIKITNPSEIINDSFLLLDKFILVQKGKKNYYLVETV